MPRDVLVPFTNLDRPAVVAKLLVRLALVSGVELGRRNNQVIERRRATVVRFPTVRPPIGEDRGERRMHRAGFHRAGFRRAEAS
jgi:hypothetical protein